MRTRRYEILTDCVWTAKHGPVLQGDVLTKADLGDQLKELIRIGAIEEVDYDMRLLRRLMERQSER